MFDAVGGDFRFLWDCVWQSTTFLIIGYLLSLVWARWPARAHGVLVLAMVACLVTPLLGQTVRHLGWGVLARPVPALDLGAETQPIVSVAEPEHTEEGSAALTPTTAAKPTLPAAAASRSGSLGAPSGRSLPWRTVLLTAWAVLSGAAVLRLLLSLVQGFRLVARARLVEDEKIRQAVDQAAWKLGLNTKPVFYASKDVLCPLIWCWSRRPVVLLPISSVGGGASMKWDGILCHELGHWKRRDHLAGLSAEVLVCALPWQPLAWWAKRRLSYLSERACDNWVLACGEPAASYAKSLLGLCPEMSTTFALSAVTRRRCLQRRIRDILRGKRSDPSAGRRWACTAAALMTCVVAAVAFAQPEARAESENEQAAPAMTLRRVWKDTEDLGLFVVSRDGKFLTYVDWGTGDLCLRELATGKTRNLTKKGPWATSSNFAMNSAISHDGSRIAYNWGEYTYDLRIINIKGGNMRVVIDRKKSELHYLQPYEWSPDGKQILTLFQKPDGTNQMVWVSVEDGSVKVLKSWVDKTLRKHWPPSASLSPDGRYIAYDFPEALQNLNKRDVFLLTSDGSREVPLVQHPAHDKLMGWSLDGKWILFGSDRSGTMDAYVIRVSDGKPQGLPELVKRSIKGMSSVGFTKDGSYYYSTGRAYPTGTIDVCVATLDPTGKLLDTPRPISRHSARFPVWSPAGQYLAYWLPGSSGSPTTGWDILGILSVDTWEERQLPATKADRFYPTLPGPSRWSPDGRFLLITGAESLGHSGLYKMDVRTGDVTCLVPRSKESGVAPGADWSRDGKAIYYSRSEETPMKILVRDVETGEEEERGLIQKPGRARVREMFVSPNGEYLAVNVEQAIVIIPCCGGEPRDVLSGRVRSVAWAPDGRHLLFLRPYSVHPAATGLWRVSIDGGEPERIWEIDRMVESLDVHADSRQLVFTVQYESKESGVWVMENFLPTE